jgi:hypothetical protein
MVTPPIFKAFACVHRLMAGICDRWPSASVGESLSASWPESRSCRCAACLLTAEAWPEVQRRGYEGLVAKDEAAPYRGGPVAPSRTWLKVKIRYAGVFLVGGVGLGRASRACS